MTGRVDANSPGSMSGNQQQQQQQQQQLAHQQAYLNPTIPPGYNLYYPAAANSMLAGGYYTNPAFLQVQCYLCSKNYPNSSCILKQFRAAFSCNMKYEIHFCYFPNIVGFLCIYP